MRIDGLSEIVVGTEITLNCSFNASPPASDVQWFKEDELIVNNTANIKGDGRLTIESTSNSQVLSINSSSQGDEANYTCHVINTEGNSSAEISVIIQGKHHQEPLR